MTIEHRCGSEKSGYGEHHPPLDFCNFDTLQVEGRALAGSGFACGLPVHLDTPNTDRALQGQDLDFLFLLNSAGNKRPRYNCAEALYRKAPVNREPKDVRVVFWSNFPDVLAQCIDQF